MIRDVVYPRSQTSDPGSGFFPSRIQGTDPQQSCDGSCKGHAIPSGLAEVFQLRANFKPINRTATQPVAYFTCTVRTGSSI